MPPPLGKISGVGTYTDTPDWSGQSFWKIILKTQSEIVDSIPSYWLVRTKFLSPDQVLKRSYATDWWFLLRMVRHMINFSFQKVNQGFHFWLCFLRNLFSSCKKKENGRKKKFAVINVLTGDRRDLHGVIEHFLEVLNLHCLKSYKTKNTVTIHI